MRPDLPSGAPGSPANPRFRCSKAWRTLRQCLSPTRTPFIARSHRGTMEVPLDHWGGETVGTILVSAVLVAVILIVLIGVVRMVAMVARDLRDQHRRVRSDSLRFRASHPKNRL